MKQDMRVKHDMLFFSSAQRVLGVESIITNLCANDAQLIEIKCKRSNKIHGLND